MALRSSSSLARRAARAITVLVVFVVLLGVGACGRHAVRPNEKEHLADRTMRFDEDRQETAADDHVLSNREGATGGRGTGGGGCGCN